MLQLCGMTSNSLYKQKAPVGVSGHFDEQVLKNFLISLRGKEQQGNVAEWEAVLVLWPAAGVGWIGERV